MPRWNDGLVDAFPIPDDRDISLAKLTIHDDTHHPKAVSNHESTPVPFFDLPAELRNRVYNLVLFSKPGYRLAGGTRKGSRLAILLASKRFHKEASYALYTTYKFLIFPLQEFTPLPTIQELPLHYRLLVTNLRMVVGSSFTAPPKSWNMTRALQRCLKRLKNLQTLTIFIEFDPSHPAFKLKRDVYESYTDFCGDLVEEVLDAMPKLKYVQLDGEPGVNVHGLLVSRLREEAEAQEKIIKWGGNAGWAHKITEEASKNEWFNVAQDND